MGNFNIIKKMMNQEKDKKDIRTRSLRSQNLDSSLRSELGIIEEYLKGK